MAMAARGVLGLIAITALMGSAACGSVSASSVSAGNTGSTASAGVSSAEAPAAQSLCAASRSTDRVVVSRPGPPHQITVTGATQVQALAVALCALPATPSAQHCLVVSADSVRLVFAAGEQSFPLVTVQESGCRIITGLGTTRSWSPSSAFGRLLSEVTGGLGKLTPGIHPSSVPTGPL
jgi:hypothetical protein